MKANCLSCGEGYVLSMFFPRERAEKLAIFCDHLSNQMLWDVTAYCPQRKDAGHADIMIISSSMLIAWVLRMVFCLTEREKSGVYLHKRDSDRYLRTVETAVLPLFGNAKRFRETLVLRAGYSRGGRAE